MKPILLTIQILIGLYFAGNAVRQNKMINEIVGLIESGYASFNKKLKEKEIPKEMLWLKTLFGFNAFVCATCFLIFSIFGHPESKKPEFFFNFFLLSFLIWFPIQWCFEHKHSLSVLVDKLLPSAIFIALFPIIVRLLDIILGINNNAPKSLTALFNIVLMAIYNKGVMPVLTLIGVEPVGAEQIILINPWLLSGILLIIFVLALLVLYIALWIFAIPITFVLIVIISIPVLFARLVHALAPEKNFVGLTMAVFILASIWLAYI